MDIKFNIKIITKIGKKNKNERKQITKTLKNKK